MDESPLLHELLQTLKRLQQSLLDGETQPDELLLSARNLARRFAGYQGATSGERTEICEALFRHVRECVLILSPEARVLDANPSAAALFRHSRDTLIGLDIRRFCPPGDRNLLDPRLPLSGGTSVNAEQRIVTDDGRRIDVDGSATLLPDGRILAIFHDVTDRNAMLEDVRGEHQRYQKLFEAIPDGVAVVDAATLRILDTNPANLELFGYSREELLNMTILDITAEPETTRSRMREMRSEQRFTTPRRIFLRKDGTTFPGSIHVNRIFHENREVLLAITRDITDFENTREELLQAKFTAERANTVKGQFLADMSHEIRTPVAAMMGTLQMLQTTPLQAVQQQYVEDVMDMSRYLLRIIGDILDFSKIEAGKLSLVPAPFSLRRVVERALAMPTILSRQKGVRFSVLVDQDLPDALTGDGDRLAQVLANLAGNAVKFTDEGTVSVKIFGENLPGGTDETPVGIRFEVKDTGIGIPFEKQALLFDSFSQVDGSLTRREKGTGLGLAISRKLVQMMGGSIDFESAPGLGSTFGFELRFERSSEVDIPHSSRNARNLPRLPQLRILLAEDNPMNRRFLNHFLTSHGHSLTLCSNGREALEILGRTDFDCALLDLQMPEMDGMEVVGRIRRGDAGACDPDLPVIALTAHALSSYRDRALKAGMDDYLTKPVELTELFDALARVMLAKRGLAPTAPGPGHADLAGDLPALEVDELRRKYSDTELVLKELVMLFLEDVPENRDLLAAAVRQNDLPGCARNLHKLRNAAGILMASRLAHLTTLAEQNLEGADATPPMDAIFDEIETTLEAVRSLRDSL